ncbi:hypothetical protein ACWDYH_24150 [Nocardia goodfellowii]
MVRPADARPAIGAGRSPITEGLAVSAAVGVSGAAKIFGDWMVDSVGKSPAFVFLGQLLSWLWWVLPLLGAGWWLYAFITDRRERSRVARELELIEQLVPPGPAVSMSGGHQCPAATPAVDPDRMANQCLQTFARLLQALAIEEYDSASLLVVLSAVLEIPYRLEAPVGAEPWASMRDFATAKDILAGLVEVRVVHPGGTHGYCVDAGLRRADMPGIDDRIWHVAVSALLEHWALTAGRWAVGLGTQELAVGARRWFESHGEYLRMLVIRFAGERTLPADVVPALARLVDVLDVWNAVLGQPEYEKAVLSDPRASNRVKRELIRNDVAWIRAGGLNERPRFYSRRVLAYGRAARQLHRDALGDMASVDCDWQSSVEKLEKAWWRLPRKDLAGEVCIAINLAIAHIVQGRFEAAAAQIELAETLARRGDPGGLAHVFEIYGALYWARGEERRALTAWQYALEQYRALADDLGAGRCQQHIGRALLAAPRYAGVLMEPEPGTELTEDNVRSHANVRLDEAAALRPPAP